MSPLGTEERYNLIECLNSIFLGLSDKSLKAIWTFAVNEASGNLFGVIPTVADMQPSPESQIETNKNFERAEEKKKISTPELLTLLGFNFSLVGTTRLVMAIDVAISKRGTKQTITIASITEQLRRENPTSDFPSCSLMESIKIVIDRAYMGTLICLDEKPPYAYISDPKSAYYMMWSDLLPELIYTEDVPLYHDVWMRGCPIRPLAFIKRSADYLRG